MTQGKPLQTLYAERALLPEGWADNVAITIGNAGLIENVRRDLASSPPGAEQLDGIVLPGIPNCHSHAFQRAMVGLTELRGSGHDSFWSWR
ncbi:MAG: formimidoylglutamate deiminase, partial [Gammaproteobacteria bacterium]